MESRRGKKKGGNEKKGRKGWKRTEISGTQDENRNKFSI